MEADDLADHEMHHETCVVPESVSDTVAETREARGWVWAVGTTVVRTLEAAFGGYERVMAAYEVAVR